MNHGRDAGFFYATFSRLMRRAGPGLVMAAALLPVAPPAGGEQAMSLTFGIVPQQSASRLARDWSPLLQELGEILGTVVQFRTTADIPTFEACLAGGAFDVAYMNPYHYVVYSENPGYRAVAHQSNHTLMGIMVVRTDSPYRTIDDLEGLQVAFPSPAAFGASILTRAEMRARDVSFTPRYVKSHDSVYRAVSSGLMPAGGGVSRTLQAADPAIRDQLRVIHVTREYTPHAIAVRPGLDSATVERVKEALLAVHDRNVEALERIAFEDIELADDGDWDDVRALGITESEAGLAVAGESTCPFD